MLGFATNFAYLFVYFASVFSKNDQIFTVYRLIPRTSVQLEFLRNLFYKDYELELDFWIEPSKNDRPVDIMVGRKVETTFLEKLTSNGLNFTIRVDDVEKLIKEREHKRWRKTVLRDDATNRDANNAGRYDIFRYKSYDEMVRYMEYLAQKYPTIAQMMNLGHTFQGRIIKFMKIGNPLNDTNKRAIWIDAGIHAREWVSQATAMYFIHTLVTEYYTNHNITNYVDKFTWYIVPNLNPDGYEYSRSSTKPQVRGWRKNRSLRTGCTHEHCCSGVDLNRNFDVFWGHYGSSENRCSHVYHGETAFSELETQAVRNFVQIHRQEMDAFITLHAHSQFWAFPYGYLTGYYPRDVKDLRTIAKRATKALQSLYGTAYKVGSSADLLGYAASGGSDDWAKSKMRIKFVYLVELRPEEQLETGYIYDEALLPEVATETWAGVKVVADAVQQMNDIMARRLQKYFQGAPPRQLNDSQRSAATMAASRRRR